MYTCLRKNVPTYLCSVLVKYELISVSWKKQNYATGAHFTYNMYQGNLSWQIEVSMQYLHVHFNVSLNSYKMTGSYCLRNHQTYKQHHYIICSKCLPSARPQARRHWHHVNHTFNKQRDSDCSRIFNASSQFDIRYLSTHRRQIFRVCSVKMM